MIRLERMKIYALILMNGMQLRMLLQRRLLITKKLRVPLKTDTKVKLRRLRWKFKAPMKLSEPSKMWIMK